jgi:hypothetical protein
MFPLSLFGWELFHLFRNKKESYLFCQTNLRKPEFYGQHVKNCTWNRVNTTERLELLREELVKEGLAAYIILLDEESRLGKTA